MRASLAELSKLMAVLHVTSVDAQIRLGKTKYTHLFWRPLTAITKGSLSQDPTWTSLEAAPQHPEYPSGHALQGGAQPSRVGTREGGRRLTRTAKMRTPTPDKAQAHRRSVR